MGIFYKNKIYREIYDRERHKGATRSEAYSQAQFVTFFIYAIVAIVSIFAFVLVGVAAYLGLFFINSPGIFLLEMFGNFGLGKVYLWVISFSLSLSFFFGLKYIIRFGGLYFRLGIYLLVCLIISAAGFYLKGEDGRDLVDDIMSRYAVYDNSAKNKIVAAPVVDQESGRDGIQMANESSVKTPAQKTEIVPESSGEALESGAGREDRKEVGARAEESSLSQFSGASSELLPVPALTARVMDETRTLNESELLAIERKLFEFERRKGTQIVVMMISTTGGEDISAYANRVGRSWRVGSKESGDGLLMFLAKNDRKIRLEVARSLEGVISNEVAKKIIDNDIVPSLKDGKYSEGIDKGVSRIISLIESDGLSGRK